MSTRSNEAAVDSPTDSPPIDPSNVLATSTSTTDSAKQTTDCFESANSPQIKASPISPSSSPSVASPTPTAVVPASIQLVGNESSRNLKASKQMDKQSSEGEDDKIYIDTKELCKRIIYELKQHSIPQKLFAERILMRSQGTLSALLRNPKPWGMLFPKGRQPFVDMLDWLKQPLLTRLRIFDMYNTKPDELEKSRADAARCVMLDEAAAVAVARFQRKISTVIGEFVPANRMPRRVFHPIQKRTLEEILKHTHRPSLEMQVQIAQHLKLDLATVSNYFINARKRMHVSDEDAAAAASPTKVPQQFAAGMNEQKGEIEDSSYKPSVDAGTTVASSSVATASFARKRSSVTRKPRTIFTSIQKRTLEVRWEIFKQTHRPSPEMQIRIAQHLKLDLSTVANYFMNARKRLRVSEETAAASVAASSAPFPQQFDAVMNDHASYYKPQDAAKMGSDI